ncbi:MAG TPA: sulfur carrier protein ThiS [Candidatus Acidoferrales bacterium]|nr:sulfur carrier protein ThiS [Candidatus Acidoferrales bacterium]
MQEQIVHIQINGEAREVPEGLTVSGLLIHLGLNPARVAIERNLGILPRAVWDATRVGPGDRYEIVQFVGGG